MRSAENYINCDNYGSKHHDVPTFNTVPQNSLTSIGSLDNINHSVTASDEEEEGGQNSKYKKDKSLGILCQ